MNYIEAKKYIDQTVHILSLLGIHITQMPDSSINRLICSFQSLQEPFGNYCPKSVSISFHIIFKKRYGNVA